VTKYTNGLGRSKLLFSQINVFGYVHTFKGYIMRDPILSQEVINLHADLCSALADPRRILILYALSEHNLNVSELADEVDISQPAASRHLKMLKDRGLVRARRQGASVVYRLADDRLIEALNLLRTVLRDRLAYRASLMEYE
jgi:DNA-binding transcriptional ArsR family regulator